MISSSDLKIEIPTLDLELNFDASRQLKDKNFQGNQYSDGDSLPVIIDYAKNEVATQSDSTYQASLDDDGVNGKPGFDFDGNDYYSIPPRSIPPGNNDYDIYILAESSSNAASPANQAIISYNAPFSGDASTKKAIRISRTVSGNKWSDSHWSNNATSSDNKFNVDTPVLASFAYKKDTNLKIYINNVLDVTDNNIRRLNDSFQEDRNAWLGKGFGSEYFNGKIAFIAVYSRILSDHERSLIYGYCKQVGWI